MNKNIFCSRKGGCTMGKDKKFYPHPRVSEILASQIKKKADEAEARAKRRALRNQ